MFRPPIPIRVNPRIQHIGNPRPMRSICPLRRIQPFVRSIFRRARSKLLGSGFISRLSNILSVCLLCCRRRGFNLAFRVAHCRGGMIWVRASLVGVVSSPLSPMFPLVTRTRLESSNQDGQVVTASNRIHRSLVPENHLISGRRSSLWESVIILLRLLDHTTLLVC